MIPRLLSLLLALFLVGQLTSPAAAVAAEKPFAAAIDEDEGNDDEVEIFLEADEEESEGDGFLFLYAVIVLALLGGGWWGWGYFSSDDSDCGGLFGE